MALDIIARGMAAKASQVTGTTSGVDGPISSTPDAIVIFDGSDGNMIKDSTIRLNQLSFNQDRISGDTALFNMLTGETENRKAEDIILNDDITGLTKTVNDNYAEFTGHTHDGRYYTEAESDERFINSSGDTVDGDLKISGRLSGPSIQRIGKYTGNGVVSGFTLSINADNTKFNVSPGAGRYINNDGQIYDVIFIGLTGITVANMSYNATYIAYDPQNEVIIQQSTPYSVSQRRNYILIGAVVHSNHIIINVVNNLPDIAISTLSQFNDLLDSLRGFNISGNDFSPNGQNLQINKTAGVLFKKGVGFSTDNSSPHILPTPELTAPSNIRFRTQTGAETGNLNYIDCGYYDVDGVRTVLANGFQIMHIALFSSNLVRIQYGQHKYNTMSEAEQALNSESFVVEQNIAENGLFRSALIVKSNATDLSNQTQARFINLNRFGDITQSVGGIGGTTTLAQAYSNSLDPEIVTNSTLKAITIKNGSLTDYDNLIEFQDLSGRTTANINALGGISGATGRFGTTTGYTTIDNDGTLKFNGSATVFDDILGQALSLRKTGTGVSDNLIEGTVEFTANATLNDYMITNVQLSHAIKIGSTIYPHIHYFQKSVNIPNMLIQYRWQKNGDLFVTDWINHKSNIGEYPYTTGSTLNQILAGSGITPPVGSGISDIIQFRIIRDTTNASGVFNGPDPLNQAISIVAFDVHIEKDSVGSSMLYIK